MNAVRVAALLAAAGLAAVSCRDTTPSPPPASPAVAVAPGTVRGHARLTGTPPPNPPIWMRDDPMCRASGATAVQEAVVAGPGGRLANVFVRLLGTFPETPVPTASVAIDQQGCLYIPRMVGIRVGQPLRVSNSDQGTHNVHGISSGSDGFNVAQPMAGMSNEFRLKTEGILRLVCDLHPWMVAFVGVVGHPYFAVTGPDGMFEIRNVPAGTYSVEAWHERLGVVTSSVGVEPGGVADVEFVYAGTGPEK
jgi:plastocyanin